MFRKIVSSLPFSPALVGQLGFYANRLRKEEVTRRAGLVFVAMALIVQSFAVFSPPESANAANPSDMIRGGVQTVNDVLRAYDSDSDFKKIVDYTGITRAELEGMRSSSINSKQYGTGDGAWLTWSRVSRFSASQGQVRHDINGTVVYSKPLWLYDTLPYTIKNGSTYSAFVGYSKKMGQFAIQKACGNIITRKLPPPPPPPVIQIQVCELSSKRVITIDEKTFDPNRHSRNLNDCKPRGVTLTKNVDGVKSKRVNINQSFDYNITVQNTGQLDLKDVKVSDPAPNGVNFTSSTEGQINNNAWSYTIPLLKIGESKNFTIKAKATTYQPEAIKNTACVDAPEVPGNPDKCDDASITLPPPKDVVVCNPLTGQIITIKETEQDKYKPVGDPACKPLEVCDLKLGKVVTIRESQFDEKKYSKNLEDCKDKVLEEKSVVNTTKNNQDATTVVADAGNRIQYTLTAKNTGKIPTQVTISDELGDVLEYAKLVDNGGGKLVANTATQAAANNQVPSASAASGDKNTLLRWEPVTLQPGETVQKTYTVQLLDAIPSTPRGISERASYDCQMVNVYGNATTIQVNCETPKVVEEVVEQLPTTGPTENMIFAGAVLAVVTFFYARSRQLKKEVRLIRRNLNTGTI